LTCLQFSTNRSYGGEGEIKILAEDIKLNGLINPITIKEKPSLENPSAMIPGDKRYEVIAGRRRVMAATLLGWEDIPSRILEGDEIERADEIAGSENINRLAMHPLDEAKIFAKMLESGQSVEDLAKRYDRKASAIWQRVQLLDLNDDIKTLFRNDKLSLHAAAMLKGLSDEAQKVFYKEFKDYGRIDDWEIKNFISRLGYNRLYSFIKDKQCAECKTRTFFGDKNLFPELDNMSDSCLNQKCYIEKWIAVLSSRIKSIKGGEHKSHADAMLIVLGDHNFEKILGKKITIDGTEYSVIPGYYYNKANPGDKGAQPCFGLDTSTSGKLEIKCEYWRKDQTRSSSSATSASPAAKRKEFAPIVNVLDMPKAEKEETLDALGNRKRLTASGLGGNVRDSVFWRIMEIKKQEFDDPKKTDSISKETFLKKHLAYLHGNGKKVFEMFIGKFNGKTTISEIAKLPFEKVFLLLAAMELNEYELVDPIEFEKGKPCDILTWAGIPTEKLKQLYQEEIRKRLPKKPGEKKAEKSKPELPDFPPHIPAKPKASGAKKTAAKKTEKKPTPVQAKKNKAGKAKK